MAAHFMFFDLYIICLFHIDARHMMVAAMMKNPILVRNITITGAMKAQMNLVSGFMKQL